MSADELRKASDATVLLTDRFTGTRRAGTVIGTRTPEGLTRKGIDTEGIIGIDNGALRIQPLLEPGWGRAGIAYGPYPREAGLAFAVFLVNGHNTSQSENLRETFRQRVHRWLMGSEVYSRKQRLIQWLLSKRKGRMLRQLLWWRRIAKDAPPVPTVNENMALGWFSSDVPADPLTDGNAFIMHATGPENGELWTRVGANTLPAVRSVQNLQIYYVVVLRERGAAYYAASVPGANGLGTYPNLRPIAIDPFNEDATVYAALCQAALGQIGFRLDTRVYAARIALLSELATWYGTAHAADRLSGDGILDQTESETGGCWRQVCGAFARTEDGARPVGTDNLALLDLRAPSGLIHVVFDSGTSAAPTAGLVWRARDEQNYWRLLITASDCDLSVKENGAWTSIARGDKWCLRPGRTQSVQVLDDGHLFSLHLDGQLLFDTRFLDHRLNDAVGVGIVAPHPDDRLGISRFEAHPRSCPLPRALDLGEPWWRLGERLVVAEAFEGAARDLYGKTTTVGEKVWRKSIGTGHIDITGNHSAKIRATADSPIPGRLAYMIDWDHPEFTDLEVSITPPGTAQGQSEHGLCGFILWQDPRNYVTINIWRYDSYGGASISTFFQLDGFEDLYDAIWSNVGNRVYWGKPHRFRVVFDGMRYMALVDDEPVLYRALTDVYADCTRLSIKRVGLLANWEWGTDTGSMFRDFRAKV